MHTSLISHQHEVTNCLKVFILIIFPIMWTSNNPKYNKNPALELTGDMRHLPRATCEMKSCFFNASVSTYCLCFTSLALSERGHDCWPILTAIKAWISNYMHFTRGQFWPSGIAVVWVCVSVYVSVCVCQKRVCPSDNSSTIQARITIVGPEIQNTLVKIPIISRSIRPWPSGTNLT